MSIARKLIGTTDATASGPAVYVEDVFSTYLYNGTGASQTITNGIDLATKGGMVWLKSRSQNGYWHEIHDTARGAGKPLASNDTGGELNYPTTITSFNTDGFTYGSYVGANWSGASEVSWTFRKQAKFFTICTWTGNGASRTISHDLGCAPGFVIIKNTSNSSNWICWHKSTGTAHLALNSTAASGLYTNYFSADASAITIAQSAGTTNASGDTYVAYLFADSNSGGFGASGTDSVVACGSFTTDGSGNLGTVNLGWEPQYIIFKPVNTPLNWWVFDTMRTTSLGLAANTSAGEVDFGANTYIAPTATGFTGSGNFFNPNQLVVYMAIRRGPMKTPTDATKVFSPVTRTGTGSDTTVSTGFPVDLATTRDRNNAAWMIYFDRLRGTGNPIASQVTNAENTNATTLTKFDAMSTVGYGTDSGNWGVNNSGASMSDYYFRRAPGFFDVVCYTGLGPASPGSNVYHNLAVKPELVISKARSTTGDWYVTSPILGTTGNQANILKLNSINASANSQAFYASTYWTTEVYNTGSDTSLLNASGTTYVAYLFATCPGVSKVGTFSINASDVNVDCGFTSGARFVLIKRTDADGDWYVWDTARGITSGNDPTLRLNSTGAEITAFDWIAPLPSGFTAKPQMLGSAGATYIYLAIA